MRAIFAVAGAALLCTAVSACDMLGGQSCNAMLPYCAVDVDLSSADWQPGTYTFEMQVGDEQYSCTETLPWPVEPHAQPCSDGPMSVNGWGVFESGAWPQKLALIDERPSKVSVRIERDGVELVSKTLRPSYKKTEPNGEGCGVCYNADESVSF